MKPPLHQSGFTLAASLFLGGRNSAAKEYNISLAVTTNIQKNIFSWLFLLAAKKNMYFLGCLAESPRKWSLSLAVLVGHQEKYVFPWLFSRAPKKTVPFLGCLVELPIPWLFRRAAKKMALSNHSSIQHLLYVFFNIFYYLPKRFLPYTSSSPTIPFISITPIHYTSFINHLFIIFKLKN